MNGEFSNLEFKYELQNKYMLAISETVKSDIVSFWPADKRKGLTEDDIDGIYGKTPIYYNIEVRVTYPTANHMPKKREKILSASRIEQPSFARNDMFYDNNPLLYVSLLLNSDILKVLQIWAKKAAKALQFYLWDTEALYLRSVRFDLIPNQDKTRFEILNLPVESLTFSKQPNSAIINSNDYLNDCYNDQQEFLNSDYVMWLKKKESGNSET